jgi:nucleoside-diphosphate-sugar epimerase
LAVFFFVPFVSFVVTCCIVSGTQTGVCDVNMTFAITGATGFIGRRICRRLHGAGIRVRALVRSPRRADKLRGEGIDLVEGSLSDATALDRLVEEATGVIHCAGSVRGATRADFDRVNVEGSRHLFEAMMRARSTPRLLALSSLAAREPGLSHYAASKRGMEAAIAASGLEDWLALRPPAVYGPGDRELLPVFRLMAHGFAFVPGAATARFSMVYVDDLADAVLHWTGTQSSFADVFTLDDGKAGGYDWADVARIVGELCHRRVRVLAVPPPVLDIPANLNRMLAKVFRYAPMLTPEKLRELRHDDWVCDSEALSRALGWHPQVQLVDGLRSTPGWAGYRPEDPVF